jgi:hypothetical protein
MFSKPAPPVIEPAPDVRALSEDLIPLSHLALDLVEPPAGWSAFLADRHIAIAVDDVGRLAVSRDNARTLLSEQREHEAHVREMAAEQERQAIEQDQRFRASLGVGVPAHLIPAGMTYAEMVASAELDSQTYRPRASMVEDLLDNGGMTFHPIQHGPDGE